MIIPTLIVKDLAEAIAFYTEVLDFKLETAWPDGAPFYAVLSRGADEMHLTLTPSEGRHSRSTSIVVCDNVDEAFAAFKARGLPPPSNPNSPVHKAPLNQSWGTREVYIDDLSGNTLVFQQR